MTGRVTATRWVSLGLVVAGMIERGIVYARHRSLWVDEAALADGLLHFSLAGITRPLPEGQVAPALFLTIERALVALFGASEYVLRLFPLLAGLLSVVLFAALAHRVCRDQPLAALIALALFAFAPALIGYAAEVKPYSCDVMVAVALPLAALWTLDAPSRTRWTVLTVFGVVGIWLSFPALFVLVGVWLALVEGCRTRALAIAPVWLLAAVPVVRHDRLITPADRAYLDTYWWGPAFHGIQPLTTVHEITVWAIGLSHATVCIALVLVGMVGLLVYQRSLAVLLLAPVLAAFVAAMLHVYPLSGRTALWLGPVVALLLGASVMTVSRLSMRGGWVVAAVLAFLLPLGRIGHPQPLNDEELGPVVAYVAAHRRPTDHLYLYYASRPVWRFYAPSIAATLGACHRLDVAAYLAELDSLPSGRVWFVASHFFTGAGVDEVQLMRVHLGRPLDSVVATNAGAWLYELSAVRVSTHAAPVVQPAATRPLIVLGC